MSVSAVRSQKLLLRKKLRKKLAALSAAKRRLKTGRILDKLFQTPVFQEARSLFAYAALPREVPTKPLILKALKLGKKVFIPRTNLQKRTLKFMEVRRWSELKKGPFGVLQPPARKQKNAVPDLLIVPGLGFDRRGGRIGQGLGFFDRFLEKYPKTPSIGLAFKEQIVKKIPREKHDLPVRKVITD